MPEVSAEQVLVVPTQLLHTLGYFQGFLPGVAGYLERLLSPQHTSYRSRADMEADPQIQTAHPLRDLLPHRRGRRRAGLPVHPRHGARGTTAASQAERGDRRAHLVGRRGRQSSRMPKACGGNWTKKSRSTRATPIAAWA